MGPWNGHEYPWILNSKKPLHHCILLCHQCQCGGKPFTQLWSSKTLIPLGNDHQNGSTKDLAPKALESTSAAFVIFSLFKCWIGRDANGDIYNDIYYTIYIIIWIMCVWERESVCVWCLKQIANVDMKHLDLPNTHGSSWFTCQQTKHWTLPLHFCPAPASVPVSLEGYPGNHGLNSQLFCAQLAQLEDYDLPKPHEYSSPWKWLVQYKGRCMWHKP